MLSVVEPPPFAARFRAACRRIGQERTWRLRL